MISSLLDEVRRDQTAFLPSQWTQAMGKLLITVPVGNDPLKL